MLTRPSIALLAAVLLAGGVWTLAQTKPADPTAAKPAAAPQVPSSPTPAPGVPGGRVWDYTRFEHVDHDAALVATGQKAISCDVCHKRQTTATDWTHP